MMRVLLAFAAGALVWFIATDTGAQHNLPNAPEARPPAGWPRVVKGYGHTVEDAKRNAVKTAAERVTALLRSQNPPLEAWQPDEEYVSTHLRNGDGQQGDDVKLDVGVVKEWIQPLNDAPKNWNEMVQLNQLAQRRVLSVERQTAAAYGLAILTALLATGWGYLRLDEWTSGRFSKWLGIGAAALLAVSGLAWWLSI